MLKDHPKCKRCVARPVCCELNLPDGMRCIQFGELQEHDPVKHPNTKSGRSYGHASNIGSVPV